MSQIKIPENSTIKSTNKKERFDFANKADTKGLRGDIINRFGASSYRLESRESRRQLEQQRQ
jgi:hypothetical protein